MSLPITRARRYSSTSPGTPFASGRWADLAGRTIAQAFAASLRVGVVGQTDINAE
jgi:hypothetical protein